MKISKFTAFMAAAVMAIAGSSCATASTATSSSASAASTSQSKSSSSSVLGGTLTNLLQGVFSKSNLTIDDIAGQWTSNGSAVSFKSDNLLKKAGGMAAAGAIEAKINPYYEKLGLTNAVLTIIDDGTFTLKAKLFTLSGTIETKGEGTFVFNFKVLGMSLGSFNAYIQKSGNHIDVMFDADKIMRLVSGIAKVTNIKLAQTAASLLDSYDGLCVGFSMNKTGEVQSTKPASEQKQQSGVGSLLQGILGGGSSSSSTSTPASSEPASEQEEKSSSSSDAGKLCWTF